MSPSLVIHFRDSEDPTHVVEHVLGLLRDGCKSGYDPHWTLQEYP